MTSLRRIFLWPGDAVNGDATTQRGSLGHISSLHCCSLCVVQFQHGTCTLPTGYVRAGGQYSARKVAVVAYTRVAQDLFLHALDATHHNNAS